MLELLLLELKLLLFEVIVVKFDILFFIFWRLYELKVLLFIFEVVFLSSLTIILPPSTRYFIFSNAFIISWISDFSKVLSVRAKLR